MSSILKGLQQTTGCGKREGMKQQVPLNKDRFLHKCELGNSATYQKLIYSLLPFYQPPYLHLCIFGSAYSTMRAALSHLTWYAQGMGSATNHAHACVWPPPMKGTKSPPQLLEHDCELTEPCWIAALLWALCQYSSHSPSPPFCFSLALIV